MEKRVDSSTVAMIEYGERCVIISAVSAAQLTWLLHGQVSFVLLFVLLRTSVPAASLSLASTDLFDSKMCSLAGPLPRFQVASLPSIRSSRDAASSLRLPCRGASRPGRPCVRLLLGLPWGNTSISCLSLCGGGASGVHLPFLGSALGFCPTSFKSASATVNVSPRQSKSPVLRWRIGELSNTDAPPDLSRYLSR